MGLNGSGQEPVARAETSPLPGVCRVSWGSSGSASGGRGCGSGGAPGPRSDLMSSCSWLTMAEAARALLQSWLERLGSDNGVD